MSRVDFPGPQLTAYAMTNSSDSPIFDVLEQVREDLNECSEERLGRNIQQRQAVGEASVVDGNVRGRPGALNADVVPNLPGSTPEGRFSLWVSGSSQEGTTVPCSLSGTTQMQYLLEAL